MTRHSVEHEQLFPNYIGLNVHVQTISKQLVQQLNQIGISISYDRFIQIEDWLAKATCGHFEVECVVVPACIRKGPFKVGALDNFDPNLVPLTMTQVQPLL